MRPPALSPAARGHLIERGLGNGALLYKEALMRSFAHKFKMIANRTAVCFSLGFLTVYIPGCVGSSPRFGESQKSAATQNDGVVVISGTTLPATNHWESETGMRFHNMPTNPAFRAYDAAFVHSIQE